MSGAKRQLGLVLLAQGDMPAALLAMGQNKFGLPIVQYALGDMEASNAALDELIECCTPEGAYQVALVYAYRGEVDSAFAWLERGVEHRDGGVTTMLVDPLLANLHEDPRWEALLSKIGLPH